MILINGIINITIIFFIYGINKSLTATYDEENYSRKNVVVTSNSVNTEQVNSLIQCSSLCLGDPNCDGYERNNLDCKMYSGVTVVTPDSSTKIYIRDGLMRELLIQAGYEWRDGNRWVKSVFDEDNTPTPITALNRCRGSNFPLARLFAPRSVADVTFMVNEHRRVTSSSDGDQLWFGLGDADDESANGIGTWKWSDGRTVQDIYGMELDGDNADDKDENDYAYFKIDNDNPKIKFGKIDDEEKGFMCEIEITF